MSLSTTPRLLALGLLGLALVTSSLPLALANRIEPAPGQQVAPPTLPQAAPAPVAGWQQGWHPDMPTLPQSALQLSSDSGSQRLPQGTLLKLKFLTQLHSSLSQTGEPFTAVLTDDVLGSYGKLLLPKGTTLRGRLSQVNSSRFFGRGGAIKVAFDHVVLPTGQQQQVDVTLSTLSDVVNNDGVLYTDPGLVAKLGQSLDDGGTLMQKMIRQGIDSGKEIGNGAGMILTVPVTAIGGAIAGAGVAAGKSAYSVVAKGEPVILSPEQIVVAQLGRDTVFPVAD